jgi:hypothetical protein
MNDKPKPVIIRKNDQKAKDRREKIEERKKQHEHFMWKRFNKESKNEKK